MPPSSPLDPGPAQEEPQLRADVPRAPWPLGFPAVAQTRRRRLKGSRPPARGCTSGPVWELREQEAEGISRTSTLKHPQHLPGASMMFI